MSGESRQELISWINDLLQLQYTKIEQVGTGAALCQIFDSIYGDVPLSKVKFNTNQEYEYVNNYKVLQKTFLDHQIDKVIPVERLVKCRFQDNLEFLQWVKKHWDMYFPGGNYDAVARRKSSSASSSGPVRSTGAPLKKTSSNTSIERGRAVGRMTMKQQLQQHEPAPAQKFAVPNRVASNSNNDALINELNQQITQLQVTVDGLEKERDFYFGKLRDIEVMTQSRLDTEPDGSPMVDLCKDIQSLLYSTEEGFEIPQENQNPANNMIEQEIY